MACHRLPKEEIGLGLDVAEQSQNPSGAKRAPACAPSRVGYISSMRALPCISKVLVATVVALSLGVFSPALALTNPEPPCCCQVRDGCEKNSTQSSCLCPACPAAHHAIPMAIMAERKCIQPLHEPAFRWSFRNEWAAGRRSAPPVPPPRIAV
jgi:hypothetical protein